MESLNLTLKPDNELAGDNSVAKPMFYNGMTIKHMQIKINEEGEIEMSKEEML